MKKYFLGFEFKSGRHTTTGEPNPKTGWCSIAGNLMVFTSQADVDHWLAGGCVTSNMGSNYRQVVTKKEARELCRGISIAEFEEEIASKLAFKKELDRNAEITRAAIDHFHTLCEAERQANF